MFTQAWKSNSRAALMVIFSVFKVAFLIILRNFLPENLNMASLKRYLLQSYQTQQHYLVHVSFILLIV